MTKGSYGNPNFRREHRRPNPAAQRFSPEQIAALSAPLNPALISFRKQGRGQVAYLKGFVVNNAANRIFGFDGW